MPAEVLPLARPPDYAEEARVRPITHSWVERDLRSVVAGLLSGTVTRPVPTVGRRSDGVCLFYQARVNTIFGESGDGKSFVGQEVGRQELAAGHHVLWVDFEDDEVGTANRLLELGAQPKAFLEFFHYFSPVERFGAPAQHYIGDIVARLSPSLVVIDSAGESMGIDGTKPNDDDSVARWMRTLPRFIAKLGPAVVVIDHTTKSREGGLWAAGSQRKRAAISGSAYLVNMVHEFGRGRLGRSKLTTAKDRNGNFVRGAKAAEFILDATSKPYQASLVPPEPSTASDGSFRPTALMEKVSRWVELHPGETVNAIRREVRGRGQYVSQALGLLVAEGNLRTERHGPATVHYCARPFREGPEGEPDAEEEPF